jgi:hypothetical protein
LAQRPPSLEGGIELAAELVDDQHAIVRLQQGDVKAEFRAAGLAVPYPSGLERLLARDPEIELVVVDRAPPGLQKAAAARGISYLDVNGRGRVVGAGLVYIASPRPDLGRVVPARSSPFAQKASRVVRVLLSDPQRKWRLSDVAVLAHLNPGNVHRALAALVDLGMVERDEDAYLVADPGSLLEAWSDQRQRPREQAWLPIGGDLRESVAQLVQQLDGDVVVSGELAAEEFAPYLPAESAVLHCLDAERFAAFSREDQRRPRLRPGVGAGEVLLDLADEGVGDFRVERDDLLLASPVQVYVDLAGERGRGREAAEHLRHAVIGF